jgi:hypothetical protein
MAKALPIVLSTVLVARLPILAWTAGSLRSGSADMDLLYADLFLGSAEMDRLIPAGGGPVRAGDFLLVDILTLVCPEVAAVGGAGLLLVGDGDGLDLLWLLFEDDLEMWGEFGGTNLKNETYSWEN